MKVAKQMLKIFCFFLFGFSMHTVCGQDMVVDSVQMKQMIENAQKDDF